MPPEQTPSSGIKWTTVTWYSQCAAIVVGVGIFFTGFYIGQLQPPISGAPTQTTSTNTPVVPSPQKGQDMHTTSVPSPVAVSLKAEPAQGESPLDVTFIIKVPNNNYSIDYGDGSRSWLSVGPNSESSGECTPTEGILCIINIEHTYTSSNAGSSFVAKLMQGTTVVATTSVIIING